MSSLEAVGSSFPDALHVVLAKLRKTPGLQCQGAMDAMCEFPSSAKVLEKGHLHISMLSYRPSSYTANGMFVGDATLLLETGWMVLARRSPGHGRDRDPHVRGNFH